MGLRFLALVGAMVSVGVPFCHHERVRVLVARQPGCRISKTWAVADACWPSARVSLCTPFLCRRVRRIRPFPHLDGRVELVLPVPVSVECKLGLWGGVVIREEVDHRDRPVGLWDRVRCMVSWERDHGDHPVDLPHHRHTTLGEWSVGGRALFSFVLPYVR